MDTHAPAWMHPDIFPSTSLNSLAVYETLVPEFCMEGPTRTSKTLKGLEKQIGLHFKIPGLRSAIVRSNNSDMDASIRYDIARTLLRYDLEDPRSPIRQEGGPTRFHTLHINDGEIRLGGLNRPKHILGTEYDLVFISQLDQVTREQYEILKTRCSGSAGNWLYPDGSPIFQIMCDMNPAPPDFWAYDREAEGRMEFIKIGFRDNPYFFRDGRWSKIGFSTVRELDRSLTGIYHDRYFKGLRVAAEGAVFEIRPEHLIDVLPDLSDYLIYNLMDFGVSKSPNVCLWLAWNPRIDDTIVFREFARTDTDTITFGHQMCDINAQVGERPQMTLTDDDINLVKILRRECGITPIQTARKGPGSINDGLMLINHSLAQTVLGKPGGLRIYKGLVYGGADPNPDANDDNLITELRNIRWDAEKSETVVGGRDHRIDPLRYWYLWKHRGGLKPGSGGATAGALNV